MHKAQISIKLRIYPSQEQEALLNRSFGCGRFIYNKLLAKAIAEYDKWKQNSSLTKPDLKDHGLVKGVMEFKCQFPWLYEVDSNALQQKARDLAKAFSSFFKKKAGFPKFKKKYGKNTLRLVGDSFRFKNDQFYIAKCKTPIKINWHRTLPSPPASCTISKDPSGKYFVSFICERDPILTSGSGIKGFDLGLSHYLVDSDGATYENPKHYRGLEQKLKRLQKSQSRRVKESNRYFKQMTRIAILHERTRNLRQDFLHKVTRTLVNENQVIGIETLRPANMVKNKHLSKSIMDAAWGMFNRFLEYKVKESGHCILIRADAFYPSTHICSHCDIRLDYKLKLSERRWICPTCGTIHDRDQNAAKNLLKLAINTVSHYKPVPGSVMMAGYV